MVYRGHYYNEAKTYIGAMNRAQQAYQLEFGEFTASISDLGIGMKHPTESYDYSIHTTPLSAFNYATPRKDTLKGYVGGTFLASANDGTDEFLTVAIACESESPEMTRPADPIVRGNVIECSPNTKNIYTSKNSETGGILLEKDGALAYNSLNYARTGQYDQALLVAETIDNGKLKEKVFKAIANQVTTANRRLQAPENLFQAVEVATTIKDAEIKAWVLADIAPKLAAANQQSLATRILSQAFDLTQLIQDSYTKAMVLADIARGLAAVGQPLQAEGIFMQALQKAKSTEVIDYKVNALTYIAGMYAAAGQYDQGLEVAKTLKSYYGKETAFEAIAHELAAKGQYDKALGVVQLIVDPNIKARILTDITRKQVAEGVAEQTERLFAQVLKVAETIPSNADRETTLEAIARELVAAGRYNQALKVVETIKDEYAREMALEALARQLAAAGRYDQALSVAKTIKNGFTQERVLRAITDYRN
ncbi:MAG: type IV pilin-like G/H family protein [Coleofasciculus sp. S288]|nr:type IV pilin-like G/H family protein [Coleofasciculus sp. S288]